MSTRPLARAAGLMVVAIFVSRVLGLVRERAVAQVFGRTEATDAFFAAFNIPDLMYRLLIGGALGAAFIPVFTGYLARDEQQEAWKVASTFINTTVILLVLFTVFGMVFTPYLAPLVAYSFTGEQQRLLITLMRIMFPAVFFTAMAGLEMGVLDSYRHFGPRAMGPIVYNLIIILGIYALGRRYGVMGMAAGVLAGAMSNFLLQFPFVLQHNQGYHPGFHFRHEGMQKLGKLMIPALVGLGVAQVNVIVSQNLASGLEPGSITALRLSDRLMQFPLGVFAMGISTAIFPTLTRQVATKKLGEFRRTVSQGLRSVFIVTIPSAMGLLVLRVPIIRLLFESGEFGPDDTRATAFALMFFSFALVAQSGIQITTRVYYSLHDPGTPVKIGVLSVCLNAFLSVLFLKTTDLNHGGLALAFSITSTISLLLYMVLLKRRLDHIDGKRITVTAMKAFAASIVMAMCVYLAADYAGRGVDLAAPAGRALQVAAGIGTGVAVYSLFIVVFRMHEVRYFWMLLRRMRKR